MKNNQWLIAGVLLLTSSTSMAGLDEGAEAYNRGDYRAAYREFVPLANDGNSAAQFNLGVMYAKGRGVTKDEAEAARWYRSAAEQGHIGAQFNLGVIYEDGRGVKRDDAEAARWYRKAADQGHADAMNQLAWTLATSRNDSVRDGVASVNWAREALRVTPDQPIYMATLGAAYAETGNYALAVETQSKAISLLDGPEKSNDFKTKLISYEAGKPWRH